MLKKGNTVKIIAYNIEFAKTTTPSEIASHLKPEDPDIICFSEVPAGEWTALVGKLLGMDYCFVGKVASANHEVDYKDKTGKYYGKYKSILSKTPLYETDEKLLTGIGWSPVSVVFARTNISGNELLIGSLHIPSGVKDPANSCAANLAELMESYDDERIIITGDYNDLVDSEPIKLLYDKGFNNAWQSLNYDLLNQKTCDAKSDKYEVVIDHLLYRGVLNPVDAEIIKSYNPQSDHYAISTSFIMNAESDDREIPSGVEFKKDTIFRLGSNGDNWCITWAADDSQITSMDDGNWMNIAERSMHNHLFRILGGSDGFKREDIPGYPAFLDGNGGWFGYGVVAVNGKLYSAVSKTPELRWSGPFSGVKLFMSDDNGQSWNRVGRDGGLLKIAMDDLLLHEVNDQEMFFGKEYGLPHKEREAYPFSFFDFVQCGRDNSAAKDEYIYIYSPEGAQSNHLLLARVHKDRVGVRGDWQYFTGYDGNDKPQWSLDIMKRQPAYIFPEKNKDGYYFGWYSWLPSVVWNEGLQLYIMVNGGTYAGNDMTDSDEEYYLHWMHTKTGSLGFWYSENPYGPWKQFFYTDYWVADDSANLTYQPTLSPKWISDDGKEMVLIWSDAMKNESGQSHSTNYKWNQMTIRIECSQ